MSLNVRNVSCVLLLCLGGGLGWAQQKDAKPQSKDKQQKQQAQPPSSQPPAPKSPAPQPPVSAPQQKPQAPQTDQQQMRGLDEEVQQIKSDVLKISEELRRLEEKLLYPSGTQVAIFVALAKGDAMRLDAVRLQIDGEMVAQYVYSAKELEALRKGGVQRLYVGNVATGSHQLEVFVEGKLEGGEDFSRSEHFAFSKEVKPKLVELTLSGPASGNAPIALGEW